jgi:hypothetical protein
MHDDVQYFPPGPYFPWANTQAATQRALMQARGIEAQPPEVGAVGVGNVPGALSPLQNQMGRPVDVNASPLSVEPPLGPAGVVPPAAAPPPGAGPGAAAGEAAFPPGPAPPP